MTHDLVLLSEVCREYFNTTERVAKRKASMGLLPVPAFRISGTQKGPYYIKRSDMGEYIERQRKESMKLHLKMVKAGAV